MRLTFLHSLKTRLLLSAMGHGVPLKASLRPLHMMCKRYIVQQYHFLMCTEELFPRAKQLWVYNHFERAPFSNLYKSERFHSIRLSFWDSHSLSYHPSLLPSLFCTCVSSWQIIYMSYLLSQRPVIHCTSCQKTLWLPWRSEHLLALAFSWKYSRFWSL